MNSSGNSIDNKLDQAIASYYYSVGPSFVHTMPKKIPRIKDFKDIRLVKLSVDIQTTNYYTGDSSFTARSVYEKLVGEGKKPVYTMEYHAPAEPPNKNYYDPIYLNQLPFKVMILLCKIKESEAEISMEELKLAVKHHPQYFTF